MKSVFHTFTPPGVDSKLFKDTSDVRVLDDMALVLASQYGYLEVVKYLVSLGASESLISQKSRDYIAFCKKMEEKNRHRSKEDLLLGHSKALCAWFR